MIPTAGRQAGSPDRDVLVGPIERVSFYNPAVVIPVLTQHYAMLKRNLFYNGVTQGKRLVALVGQKMAAAIAMPNAFGRRCWPKLDECLTEASASSAKTCRLT